MSVMLAETWDGVEDLLLDKTGREQRLLKPTRQNLAGWWISEKLDGVRAIWDCRRRQLFSRNGNQFNAPEWFLRDLPSDVDLDGELWLGRGRFFECNGITKRALPRTGGVEWKQMKYMVFDSPLFETPYEERLEIAKSAIHAAWANAAAPRGTRPMDYLQLVQQVPLPGNEHVVPLLDAVMAGGGEGLIARAPGSAYEDKRSTSLLKIIRLIREDGDVVGYEDGKAGFTGMTGALKVRLPDNYVATVGTGLSMRERRNPPRLGARVTIEYKGRTPDGKTREPRYMGERNYE